MTAGEPPGATAPPQVHGCASIGFTLRAPFAAHEGPCYSASSIPSPIRPPAVAAKDNGRQAPNGHSFTASRDRARVRSSRRATADWRDGRRRVVEGGTGAGTARVGLREAPQ